MLSPLSGTVKGGSLTTSTATPLHPSRKRGWGALLAHKAGLPKAWETPGFQALEENSISRRQASGTHGVWEGVSPQVGG